MRLSPSYEMEKDLISLRLLGKSIKIVKHFTMFLRLLLLINQNTDYIEYDTLKYHKILFFIAYTY